MINFNNLYDCPFPLSYMDHVVDKYKDMSTSNKKFMYNVSIWHMQDIPLYCGIGSLYKNPYFNDDWFYSVELLADRHLVEYMYKNQCDTRITTDEERTFHLYINTFVRDIYIDFLTIAKVNFTYKMNWIEVDSSGYFEGRFGDFLSLKELHEG